MAGATAAESNEAAMAEISRRFNNLATALRLSTQEALIKVAVEVLSGVQAELSLNGSGRTYYIVRSAKTGHRYWSDSMPADPSRLVGTHVASAPGDPPAADTGAYRRSWAFDFGEDELGYYSEVGSSSKLGPWLEFGTAKMKARPHLRPVVLAVTTRLSGIAVDEVIKAQQMVIATMKVEEL